MNPSDGALLDSVRSVRWPARRKAPAGITGDHASWMRGISTEFTEYRAYRQGDEVGKIDWKLLARSDRAYIRLSTERTLLPTVIVLDASASMAFPSATLEKWHHARRIAVGLAAAAHNGQDPVGIAIAAEGDAHFLPTRARRDTVRHVMALLDEVNPSGSQELAPILDTVWRRYSHARVAVVSDFLGDADEMLRVATTRIAAGREVHAVHVVHPSELSPSRKTALVVDPERVDFKRPVTESSRIRYLENFASWRRGLARDWRMAGAWYTEAVTDQAAAHTVRGIVIPPDYGRRG